MKRQAIIFRNSKSCIILYSLLFFVSCSSTSQTEVEEGALTDDTEKEIKDEIKDPENIGYDITSVLSVFDDIEAVHYTVSNGKVTISTTNLPDHKSPYYLGTEWDQDKYADYSGTNPRFHLNPNRIGEQNITFSISLNPKEATNKQATPMGPIGISRNGVVFFNQYAAGFSTLDNEINSFDQYLGHPAGSGMYHYHIEPVYLTEVYGDDAFLGLLADGFPVYGPVEDGETLSSTDLDDYHGHFSETKEFPNGMYHYHISADAPYLNGDGFYGTAGTISR
tara:strand:+ start:31096 stop:31932 length:837 start_codon:yes stop_codon:yes gene_type:complete